MYSREATGGAQGARAPSLPRDGSLPPVAPPLEGVERVVPEQGAYSDAEEESCLAPATRGEADAVPARLPSGWAVGTFSTSNSRRIRNKCCPQLHSLLYALHYARRPECGRLPVGSTDQRAAESAHALAVG